MATKKGTVMIAGAVDEYRRYINFRQDHFEKISTGLDSLYGWWQAVAVADLNGDGREDIVLGNIGENFNLHPDEKKSFKNCAMAILMTMEE